MIKNGTLYVPSFDPTGEVGEYTITAAVLNSLTCPNGAYDVTADWIIWSAVTDPNTGNLITGVARRYKVLEVVVTDFSVCDLKILWDEPGLEIEAPANGSVAIISEASPNHRFGFPISSAVYPDVFNGASEAAYNSDILNITDSLGGGGGTSKVIKTFSEADWTLVGQDLILDVIHRLGSLDVLATVYEQLPSSDYTETVVDKRPLDSETIRLTIAEASAFSGKIILI